jgi:dephospho-CoA kinase
LRSVRHTAEDPTDVAFGGADCAQYSGVVTVVFVTGMSGTGKSAALGELARRGHLVVDTDYGAYAEDVQCSDAGDRQQLWREDRIEALLDEPREGVLFISGCVSNQAKFYPRFDAVVLLAAPPNVILERVASRESNAFGKREAERNRILDDLANVEPLLRAGATAEIDTRAPLEEVADALERIAAQR